MRTFEAVDAHGNDGRVGLVRDHRGAVVDLHQAAGDGQAAFRKDDERRAVLHGLDQVAHAERARWIDGVELRELQKRFHPPRLRHRRIDGISRVRRQQGVHQRRVEQADVIRRDDGFLAGLRKIFETSDLKTEEGLEQEYADVLDALGTPGAQHERDDDEVCNAERRIEKRDRTPSRTAVRRSPSPTSVMNAADSTLQPAMTRERRSTGDHACTAANEGTM